MSREHLRDLRSLSIVRTSEIPCQIHFLVSLQSSESPKEGFRKRHCVGGGEHRRLNHACGHDFRTLSGGFPG